MFTRYPYNPAVASDDLGDIPSQGFWPKWFGGIAVPFFFIAYGVKCFLTQHAVVYEHNVPIEFDGAKAIALGVASAGLGLFLHCHYFWGNIYHLSFWATLGKIISAIAFIAGLVYLIVRVGFVGR